MGWRSPVLLLCSRHLGLGHAVADARLVEDVGGVVGVLQLFTLYSTAFDRLSRIVRPRLDGAV